MMTTARGGTLDWDAASRAKLFDDVYLSLSARQPCGRTPACAVRGGGRFPASCVRRSTDNQQLRDDAGLTALSGRRHRRDAGLSGGTSDRCSGITGILKMPVIMSPSMRMRSCHPGGGPRRPKVHRHQWNRGSLAVL
jgi:hypothetical protein